MRQDDLRYQAEAFLDFFARLPRCESPDAAFARWSASKGFLVEDELAISRMVFDEAHRMGPTTQATAGGYTWRRLEHGLSAGTDLRHQ